MAEQASEAGFNRRHPTQDPWVAGLLEEYGLAPDASLEEIEPIVMELWNDVHTRYEAIMLVLGRRVDGSEPGEARNPLSARLLASIVTTSDPSEAFGGLLLLKTYEELLQNEGLEQ